MMILAMMMMMMMMMMMSSNTRVHTPHTRVTEVERWRVALILALLDQLDCDLDLNLAAGDDDDVPPASSWVFQHPCVQHCVPCH